MAWARDCRQEMASPPSWSGRWSSCQANRSTLPFQRKVPAAAVRPLAAAGGKGSAWAKYQSFENTKISSASLHMQRVWSLLDDQKLSACVMAAVAAAQERATVWT